MVLGGLAILDVGSDAQKQQYLPDFVGGESIFTLALTEAGSASFDAAAVHTKAAADGGDYVINGAKLFVPYAHVADYILCAARTEDSAKAEDGITLFIVNAKAPGIKTTVLHTLANDKLCEVIFEGVKVSREDILGQPEPGLERDTKNHRTLRRGQMR